MKNWFRGRSAKDPATTTLKAHPNQEEYGLYSPNGCSYRQNRYYSASENGDHASLFLWRHKHGCERFVICYSFAIVDTRLFAGGNQFWGGQQKDYDLSSGKKTLLNKTVCLLALTP